MERYLEIRKLPAVDTINEILDWLNYDTLVSLLTVEAQKLKTDVESYVDYSPIWKKRAKIVYDVDPALFSDTFYNPRVRYLMILTAQGDVGVGSERYIEWAEFLDRAIKRKRRYLVEYAISMDSNNLRLAWQQYFLNGEIPTYMRSPPGGLYPYIINLEQYAFLQQYFPIPRENEVKVAMLLNVVQHGDLEIIKAFMTHIPSGYYTKMMKAVFLRARIDIFDLFWQTDPEVFQTPNLDFPILYRSGDIAFVEHVLSRISPSMMNIYLVAMEAAQSGNTNFYIYVVDKFFQGRPDLTLPTAGNIEMLKYVVNLMYPDGLPDDQRLQLYGEYIRTPFYRQVLQTYGKRRLLGREEIDNLSLEATRFYMGPNVPFSTNPFVGVIPLFEMFAEPHSLDIPHLLAAAIDFYDKIYIDFVYKYYDLEALRRKVPEIKNDYCRAYLQRKLND